MIAPELSRLVKASEIGAVARAIPIETTPDERAAVATRFGLLALDSLTAETNVRQDAAGVRVSGRVLATATQACALSGEPVPARIDTPLDLLFVPDDAPEPEEEIELTAEACDVLPFDGQAVDLGEAVAQTLGLALDPYPRADETSIGEVRGLILTEEEAVAARSPFAALKSTH